MTCPHQSNMKNLKEQILLALKSDKRKVSKDAKLGRVISEINDAILEARKEFLKKK
jgi:hypothetical protein